MLKFFNKIFTEGVAPVSFRRAIIFPLHKKGDVFDAANCRPISFIDVIANIFLGILSKRLGQWMKHTGIFKENQAGIRPGYSTADNIFVLYSIVNYYLNVKRKKIYGFFY